MICSWCILIYKKEIIFDGSFNLPDLVTTSQDRFLYYLSVWKIFSKNSFFLRSQGVSLSIADAKVDTFCKPTKHYWNFFITIFTRNSQYADLQAWRERGDFNGGKGIGIYMLQNTDFEKIKARNGGKAKGGKQCLTRSNSLENEKGWPRRFPLHHYII